MKEKLNYVMTPIKIWQVLSWSKGIRSALIAAPVHLPIFFERVFWLFFLSWLPEDDTK